MSDHERDWTNMTANDDGVGDLDANCSHTAGFTRLNFRCQVLPRYIPFILS